MPSSIKITQLEHQRVQDMYLQHHDWLLQWLHRRIHYPFTAADVVQDTFVKILQTQQRIFSIEDPRSYLIHTAKHVVIDQHRRYTLEQSYLNDLYDELQAQQLDIDQNQIEDALQVIEFLNMALKDCSALARKAFLLYYFEGYNQSEVAEMIGKSLRMTQIYLGECLSLCYSVEAPYQAND